MTPLVTDTHDSDARQSPNQDDPTRFAFDVDDITYHHDRPHISGLAIMDAAGINPSDGLIQLLPDGSRVTIKPDDQIHLVPGTQFKRRPRFKRG